MKRFWILSVAALLCGAGFLVGRVSAGDEMGGEGAAMEAPGWMQAAPEHEKLKKMVGDWDAALKFLMAPGQWTESTGKASFKTIMNGFFVEQTFHGDMMGQPFDGRGLHGYDTVRKEYITVWIDAWSPYMYIGRGGEAGGVTTLSGEEPSQTKEGLAPFQHITKWEGDDKMLLEVWATGEDGKLALNGSITYTRKK